MENKKIVISGAGGSFSAKIISDIIPKNRQSLIIVSGRSRAERLAEDLSFFCDEEIFVLPPDDDVFVKYEAKNRDQEIERAKVVRALDGADDIIVIAPASGAVKHMGNIAEHRNNVMMFHVGDPIDRDKMIESITSLGYERDEQVYGPGQYAVRGGIIDIFPLDYENPVRIDFFGDVIESLRIFDVYSQRSVDSIDELQLYPLVSSSVGQSYIWDYLQEGNVIIEDPERIIEHLKLRERELWNDLEYLVEKGQATFDEGKAITGLEDFFKTYDFPRVYFLQHFSKQIEGLENISELISLRYIPPTSYNNHLELLRNDLKSYANKGYKTIISASSENRVKTLREFLTDNDLDKSVTVKSGSLSSGMILPEEGICYISDKDIFDTSKLQGKKRRRIAGKGKPINSFTELKPGEYVVHENHGIGIFQGLVEVETEGENKDYIKIKYRGDGMLYVPVERMDYVQKYIGSDGQTPKINKLGSPEWSRTKQRAKKAVADMTDELVALYAKRKNESGYAFSEDTVWQAEFEDSFQYVETPDQLRSIEEIKKDMENNVPMDRLLCGDVGYGKTEVAARAIFKCLIEGKQAVVLVPTTILASQHFETLKERFKNYPFEIELMSRFRTDKELRDVAERLSKGKVDLVIGTHRVLSDDVKFKDLGLLVVDEEQRFGVAHKEKLKKLKAGIDVLTLSATPIPRTLNMSLTGIRDMSLITEPPEERYPVQTYVMEQDDDLIREVINRELDRSGQVFVVYNRVRGIIQIADRIRELVPDANVAVAHGQMSESSLEDVMRKFVSGECNVLVTTTIIESGLDIPNANTLIVLDSDKCGLAQLYQLRGRVGRSNRVAYAYLTYQKEKVLTEIAEKRLRAVREFTEFGAGFKIAMRDMELRGAGNVLGAEQSGHMLDVGYEMYARMIEESAKEARGETVIHKKEDFIIELKIAANIPSWYIDEEGVKLSVYKQIADVDNMEEAEDLMEELVDRFGDLPKETVNIIKVSVIRSLADRTGLSKIQETNNRVYLYVDENNPVSPYDVMLVTEKYSGTVKFYGGEHPYFSFDADSNDKLDIILGTLEILSCTNN